MPRPVVHLTALAAAAARLDDRALGALRAAGERYDVAHRASRATREIALTLAAVLLVGAGAATAQTPGETVPVAAAAPVAPAPPVAPRPAPPAQPTELISLAERVFTLEPPAPKPPAAAPPRRPAPKPAAVPPPPRERWLPTGTGMWLHEWHRSQGGDARDVVARSLRSGFTHLYVQTGSTRKGWIGDEVLTELLPATRGTGIAVIAWDFPKLIDPEADARRMARAVTAGPKGGPRVMAVAPDIETAAEGTRINAPNVTRYYAELRRRLPAEVPILATVPWPSEKRTGSYPYAATAPWSDAFIPMAYWYNRSPAVVTATSMTWLARFGKPVMPVGQGYDGRLDAPYLKPDPTPYRSVDAFVDTARQHGARSISLWSWQTTGDRQWTAITDAKGTIGPAAGPKAAPPAVAPPDAAVDAARGKAPGRQRDRPKGQGKGASNR